MYFNLLFLVSVPLTMLPAHMPRKTSLRVRYRVTLFTTILKLSSYPIRHPHTVELTNSCIIYSIFYLTSRQSHSCVYLHTNLWTKSCYIRMEQEHSMLCLHPRTRSINGASSSQKATRTNTVCSIR